MRRQGSPFWVYPQMISVIRGASRARPDLAEAYEIFRIQVDSNKVWNIDDLDNILTGLMMSAPDHKEAWEILAIQLGVR